LAALLIMVLGSHALIPDGFMPGEGGLVLCSGFGPMAMAHAHAVAGMRMGSMDMSPMGMSRHIGKSGQDGRSPNHGGGSACPFAAAASAMAITGPTSLVLHSPFGSTDIDLPHQPVIPRGTIVPTRLPRGPPALA
jgi:hypothetical protein